MDLNIEKGSVKAVFIDIGGVLLTNGWSKDSREAAAKQFDFDFSEMNSRHDLVFEIYEEGRISLETYLDTILFYEARPFTTKAFKEFMFQQSQALTETLNALVQWKEKHPQIKTFSLNNEPKDLHAYRVEQFGLRRVFDGFVCSCDIGLRKPDPKMFALAVAIAGVSPAECLYIDDRPVLVDAGRKAGLHALVHTDVAETMKVLSVL